MNILIINTSELTGGAAVAANRLMHALTTAGVEVRMLVRDKQTQDSRVTAIGGPFALLPKIYERLCIFVRQGFSCKRLWQADIANVGLSVTSHPLYRWADVIHINWVNQGMLSLKEIERMARDGKRIVWTMHDVWNATAVCHLTLDCTKFTERCEQCHLLSSSLASQTWKRKRKLYTSSHFTFTTCSQWLRGEALKSGLMHDQRVIAIPNSIDTSVFHPQDRAEARRALGIEDMGRKLILFVAQRLDNPFKGASYLIDAVKQVAATDHNVGIIILGSNGSELSALLPGIKTYDLGYQSDPHHIAQIYAASDVFVLPSLSENLPNTIMEALACGIPSVGFNVGGIPEMIDHQTNGYVAGLRDTADLAAGIRFCLDDNHWQQLSDAAITKVESCYSMQSVAQRFIELYNS